MIARLLALLLFAEFFLYSGYAISRVVLGRWTPWVAILFMVLMPLMLRGVLVAASFCVAWVGRTPRAAVGTAGLRESVLLFLREWGAALYAYGPGQAFESSFNAADRLPQLADGRLPVVLVHGYLGNRGIWWRLRDRLERAGHVVASVTLEPAFGGIDAVVPVLQERIEAVCAQTGAARVVVVGHSFGGLVARACAQARDGGRIARVITVGTPHRGTVYGYFGPGANARDMRPGSAALAALGAVRAEVPVVAIYSIHDNIVVPQENGVAPGMQPLPVRGRGHNEFLFSGLLCDLLLDQLRVAQAAAGVQLRGDSSPER